MKVDVDIVNPVQRKIRVELPPEVVTREFSHVYGRMVQRARIKGFRPGKVPRQVLEGIYGDEVRGEVLTHLVESSLKEVFRERGLSVVSRPQVDADDLAEGKSFAFSAVVEVKPKIEIQDYLSLELNKVKIPVTDQQVDQALARLQEQHARLEPVEESRETIEAGDFVLLDFLASIAGKPIPGGKAENYLLEIGSRSALPDFEDALVGLKKNVQQTIPVTYPEDYPNRELAGKAAMFSVTVREIKRKVRPALDDEFARDAGESATLDELRGKIRLRLEEQINEWQKRQLKEEILNRLVDAQPFDVPSAMVERQVRYLMDRRSKSAAAHAEERQDASADEIRRELEKQALQQVRGILLAENIAEREKISVTDSEVQQRIEETARSAGGQAIALRKLYSQEEAREELRAQMIFDRTLEFLLGHAKVT
ncbi:MAG: trigger factor, partial [Candidatus Binatia bacterium]